MTEPRWLQVYGLAGLREQASMTQEQVAGALGSAQSAVSRLERQTDFLMSTLRDYAMATGGVLHVVVEFPERRYEVLLPSDSASERGEPMSCWLSLQRMTERLQVTAS